MSTPNRITSKANPLIKELSCLSPTKERFLVEGFHLVEVAHSLGCLDMVLSCEKVAYGDVPVVEVSEDIVKKLSSVKTPEGVVGVAHLNEGNASLGPKVLVLDRVQDPANVGALLRSAVSFGYKDVFFLQGSANPLAPKALLASQGALFHIRSRFFSEPSKALSFLKENDYSIIATALKGAIPLREAKPRIGGHFALILGNEGRGVSADILSSAGLKVRIEMEDMESLNVSVAGGILMYSL